MNENERVVKSEDEWRQSLTPEQFHVTRQGGTERAFTGCFWDHHAAGRYHCVGCGALLFTSEAKFDSGSGWPSFTAMAVKDALTEHDDDQLARHRTEVRCRTCDGHLGHVFPDGPPPTGLRYCINSAALAFRAAEAPAED